MINFILYTNKDYIFGYEVKGHSTTDENDFEGKIVCSAVSSAAIMTANTITEIICEKCDIRVEDGYLKILLNKPNRATNTVLEGLKLHINELSNEYPKRIKITMEEIP